MKKIFISLIFLILPFVLKAQTDVLRFNQNGEFKVLQFTDTHHNPESKSSYQTFETIKTVIKKEQPDFIVVTGDIITANPAAKGWHQLSDVLSSFEIPWTITFGNHDEEHDLSKEEIYKILRKKPFFIGEKGHASGILNFEEPIYGHNNNEVASVLYFLDSHDYVTNPLLGDYDWIKHDQIEWYKQTSTMYAHNNQNKPIPSAMFFHIPLVEYHTIDKEKTFTGDRLEESVASSDVNSGLLAEVLLQKDVMGIFTGHDHDNNYIGIHKNVALAFGNVTGADAYGSLERGGRVIILKEGLFSFESYITTPTKVNHKFFYPAGLSVIDENSNVLSAQNVSPKNKGLKYKYYEEHIEQVSDIQKYKAKKEGIVNSFNISNAEQEDHYAFQFEGYFYAPKTAFYNFYIYSDDGAVLKIDNMTVVDNDGGHSPRRKEQKIALEKGYHKLNLDYFEDYMGQILEVGFSSIAIPEQELTIENLFYE